MYPSPETLSRVGLNPTTPQNAAGRMTEPVVCVPKHRGARPAATAAAEPLLEPPGVCLGLWGVRGGAGAGGRLGICVQQLPGLAPQSAESAFFGDECPHLRLACLEVIFQITDVSYKIQLAGTKAPVTAR